MLVQVLFKCHPLYNSPLVYDLQSFRNVPYLDFTPYLDFLRNVPYDWINKQKSNQHWLKKQGEKFLFPGGGTMFPNGVSKYVDLMQDLIPGMKDGTIRTAIDTGCGVSPNSMLHLGADNM